MPHVVKSRFSICSSRIGAEYLIQEFPWPVVEAVSPNAKIDANILTFDLGVGQHERVDEHLAAVKRVLLAHEKELDTFSKDCSYALWLLYAFPAAEGALNLRPNILAAFGMLNIEIIFNLKPTT